jgi:excinuclease ABC subunit A
VESLSAYARQFLERMEKPDVDSIEGLSPAVAIEQKNPTKTSRSTVGTATEVYDYLRLLWARVGAHLLPQVRARAPARHRGERGRPRGRAAAGTRYTVAFPLRLSAKVTHAVVAENLRAQGFVRVAIDGEALHLDDVEARGTDLTTARELLVVVDRLATRPRRGRRAQRRARAPRSARATGTRRCCSPRRCRRRCPAARAPGTIGSRG